MRAWRASFRRERTETGAARVAKNDAAPMTTDHPPHPALIFDGECALCSRSVRFVLRWERTPGVLRFAPMQSDAARELLCAHGFDPDALTSVVLIEPGTVWVRSRAVLRLLGYLRAPWRWGRVLGVVPRFLLDAFYRLLARHRYAVFGKVDRCVLDERIAGRTL
jgi:predicted DCC family thiol-disulfide oxidoreductase YuxK